MSLNGIETEEDEKQVQNIVAQMEKEGRQTEVKITWCAYDVLSLDTTLTPEQVEDVLSLMQSEHDATIGITWDTIEHWIDYVKNN